MVRKWLQSGFQFEKYGFFSFARKELNLENITPFKKKMHASFEIVWRFYFMLFFNENRVYFYG